MPSYFPTIRSGAVTMYGGNRSVRFNTGQIRFTNDSRQSWPGAQQLGASTLVLRGINQYDLNTVEAFFRSNLADFNATWSLVLAGITYNNLCFDQSNWTPQNSKGELFDVMLKIKQVQT